MSTGSLCPSGPPRRSGVSSKKLVRSSFQSKRAGVTVWTGKPDGLLEVYTADRTPAGIYVNIKSPAEIDEAGIR